jgi:hypothetical protein
VYSLTRKITLSVNYGKNSLVIFIQNIAKISYVSAAHWQSLSRRRVKRKISFVRYLHNTCWIRSEFY